MQNALRIYATRSAVFNAGAAVNLHDRRLPRHSNLLQGRLEDTSRQCAPPPASRAAAPIRMLRLAQVISMTGLGKTKIYEMQAEGAFPMRVKLTAHAVGWIEEEVQAWLMASIHASASD